ncbi:MAG: hypothetical protein HRT47_01955 [Candidatus Caenarcaniphilales bacterium]|nr:hypothetical protein [Candidatus Caenarcaniphilales bacterium]
MEIDTTLFGALFAFFIAFSFSSFIFYRFAFLWGKLDGRVPKDARFWKFFYHEMKDFICGKMTP